MWRDISEIVAKTMIACGPTVATTYFNCFPDDASASAGQRRCFHILGVDMLLDGNLQPQLLELNHNPSFTCDTEFDHELKGAVVHDTLELLDPQPFDKKAYAEQFKSHMAARSLKKASTPLEREKLEQLAKLERQRAAKAGSTAGRLAPPKAGQGASDAEGGSGSSTGSGSAGGSGAATNSAAATAAAAAETVAALEAMPRTSGRYELALSASGAGFERLNLFSSPALQAAWRHCCGVRGRKLNGTRFQRFVRDCGLMDSRLTQPEVHILFQARSLLRASKLFTYALTHSPTALTH